MSNPAIAKRNESGEYVPVMLRRETVPSLVKYLEMTTHITECIERLNAYRWTIMRHDPAVKLGYVQVSKLYDLENAECIAEDALQGHKLATLELLRKAK